MIVRLASLSLNPTCTLAVQGHRYRVVEMLRLRSKEHVLGLG